MNDTLKCERASKADPVCGGQVKNLGYGLDDHLESIGYTNALHPTPDVSFGFDSIFDRLATMNDGSGMTNFNYVPYNPADAVFGDGQLSSVDGPLVGDTLGGEEKGSVESCCKIPTIRDSGSPMARQVRIQFPGALYRVMVRGDRLCATDPNGIKLTAGGGVSL